MKALAAVCLGLSLLLPAVAKAQTPPTQTPPTLPELIETYAAGNDFNGVVQVTEGGRSLYVHAFGQTDRAFATPTTETTRFRVASITKLFAATLVLQLQEEGLLDVDAPVGRYLPDLPGEAATRVTLRQLLNHTSGMAQLDAVGSYQEAFAKGMAHYQRPMTTEALVANCCTGALVRAPGTAFDYNNADYILLAAIIGKVTGQSWEEALRARILTPLGLNDTGVAHWDAIVPRLAPTYFFRDDLGTLIPDMPIYPENWSAAGAMYSTTADLSVFADALFGGRLLKPASLDQLLTPGLDDYGFGAWSYAIQRGGQTWHVLQRPGQIMGARGVLYRLREKNLTVAILSNTNKTDLEQFAQKIADRIIADEAQP